MKMGDFMKKSMAVLLSLVLVLTGLCLDSTTVQAVEVDDSAMVMAEEAAVEAMKQAAELNDTTELEVFETGNTDNTASEETLESLGFDLPESFETNGLNPGKHQLNSMEELVVGFNALEGSIGRIFDHDTASGVQNMNWDSILNSFEPGMLPERTVTISFDGDGDGRKEYVAYLYLEGTDKGAGYGGGITLKIMKVEDGTGAVTEVCEHATGASIKTDYNIPFWSIQGLINIVAGDFDGDGIDELALYTPSNGDDIESVTEPYTPNRLDIRVYDFNPEGTTATEILANEQVFSIAEGTSNWTNSKIHLEGYEFIYKPSYKYYFCIPYVSLTADDVNGDGIDDLMAVTNFATDFRGLETYLILNNSSLGKAGYTWEQVLNPNNCFASILDVYEGTKTENGTTSFKQTVTKKPLVGKDNDGGYVLRNATAVVADITGVGSREIVFGGNYTKITYNDSTTTSTRVTNTRKVTMDGECLNVILGHTTYENLVKDQTPASSVKYNWIQQKGNSNKICQEERPSMNEPVSLIGFSAFGSAMPDAIFMEGQVFSYGDEGKLKCIYTVPAEDESDKNQNRWIAEAVAGNATNSAIGQETVFFPYYIRRNDGVITSRIISVWGDNASGNYTSYETDKLGEGITVSAYLLDIDEDSSFIQYTEGDVDVYYGDVEILSVLQAAPTWKELGDYGENGETAWAKTTGSGSSQSNEVTLSAGVIIGFEQEVSVLGLFKLGGMEFETSIVGSAGYTGETSVSKEYTSAYNTDGTDDVAVIFTVPYVRYNCEMYIPTYTVPTQEEYNAKKAFLAELEANLVKYLEYNAAVTGGTYSNPKDGFNDGYTTKVNSGNYDRQVTVYQNYVEWMETTEASIIELGGGGEHTWGQEIPGGWEPYYYCIPQTPVLTTVNVDTYDTIMAGNGKQTIYGNIFDTNYRAGDPSSYAHNTSELKVAAGEEVLAGKTNFGNNADSDGFITSTSISASTSAPSQSISVTKENAKGVTYGAAVEMSAVGNAGGVQVGAVTSVEYGGSNVWTTTEGCEYSGCVPNLPEDTADTYSYSWKLVSYLSSLNGQKVPVVGYLTKMQQTPPPSVPDDLTASALNSDSVIIQWSQGSRPADYFELYRVTYSNNKQYEDLIATVSEHENGVYNFVDNGDGEGLDAQTTYYYAVKAFYENDKKNESVLSEIVAATTMVEGTTAKATIEGLDGSTTYLAGRDMVLTAVASSTVDYAIRSCKWECNKGNGWVEADGVNDEPTYTFRLSTLKNGWSYRCNIEARIGNKINGVVYQMSSDPVTLNVRRVGTALSMSATKKEGATDISTGYGPAGKDSLNFSVWVVPEAETNTNGDLVFVVTHENNQNGTEYPATVQDGVACAEIAFAEAGKYTIQAAYEGNEDCEGSATTLYTYLAYTEEGSAELFDFSSAVVSLEQNIYGYTGKQICPEVTVVWNQVALVKDVDYTVTYGANVEAGAEAGSVTVTPIGKFAEQQAKTVNFEITHKVATITVEKNAYTVEMGNDAFALGATTDANVDLSYTGYDSSIITVDKNGMVTPVGAGTTQITISLADTAGYLVESKTVTVTVTAKKVTAITAVKAKNDYVIGDTLNTDDLTVTVTYEGGSQDTVTDYTIDTSMVDMTTAGSKTFTVTFKDISATVTVNVKAHTVMFNANGGTNLSKSSVTISTHNANLGKLPTVSRKNYTFKGWFTAKTGGTKIAATTKVDKSMTLYAQWTKVAAPAKVSAPILSSKKDGQITVSFKKVTNAKGYEIAYSTTKNFTKATTKTTTLTKTSKTLTKLTPGKTYYVKIRAYALDGSKNKVYGKYGSAKNITLAPKKATAPTLKSSKSGQLTVTIKKVAEAKGYEITYSTTKNFTKATTKTTTVTKTSATLKNLKKGNTYYVKIRVFVKDASKKNVYGAYSAVKSVKIKK